MNVPCDLQITLSGVLSCFPTENYMYMYVQYYPIMRMTFSSFAFCVLYILNTCFFSFSFFSDLRVKIKRLSIYTKYVHVQGMIQSIPHTEGGEGHCNPPPPPQVLCIMSSL